MSGGGVALLRQRMAAMPQLVERALDGGLRGSPGEIPPGARVRVAGVGSSRGQAKLLAALLRDAGWRAAEEPLLGVRAGAGEALVVISQGLSPGARRALAQQPAEAHLVLVTSLDPGQPSSGESRRLAWLADAERAGLRRIHLPVDPEFGTLVRVQGPIIGLVTILQLAEALGWAGFLPAAAIKAAVARAFADPLPAAGAELGRMSTVLLGSGEYRDLLDNLALKVGETLWADVPPIHDPGEVAHGIFQQGHDGPRQWIAFTCPDAGEEGEALARLAEMLPPQQELLRIAATLPGPFCLLEHEILWTRLLLDAAEARGIDPARWPGQGRDEALYAWGDDALPPQPRGVAGPALDDRTSPNVAANWSAAPATVIVPLGSLEQHGAHLPLDTDTRIADALAERLCRRLPGASRVRAIPFGMADEHLSFAGTLSLAEETFERLLGDILASLAAHGVQEIVLFSAHGGNDAFLREKVSRLASRGEPARLLVLRDSPAVEAALARVAARDGVTAAEGGWHAGEYETSILLGIAPAVVAAEHFAAGVVEPRLPPEEFFYPDLARHAPGGVVGDPRRADATRSAAYLDAWADELERLYRERTSTSQQNGTKNA